MGLDLEPLGRARAGHEAEWDRFLNRIYAGEELPPKEAERLMEISIPPYADIGAPQVGSDAAADSWLIARAHAAGATGSDAEIIASQMGYYVVELLAGKSDGVPVYSNSGLGYVEATSFRGEFLKDCTAFLDQRTIALAWRTVIPPAEAIVYGRFLLAALDRPAGLGTTGKPDGASPSTGASIQEQRQIIDAASRWYVFWGTRGNPVWANY